MKGTKVECYVAYGMCTSLQIQCDYYDLRRKQNNANLTYNETQLPLHDAVGRYPPLDLNMIWLVI